MGAANSVRKLTVDSIALLEQLEPNADELQKKRQVREYMQHVLAQEWPLCRVLPFGSSER
jgi:DNA polymerase sigma